MADTAAERAKRYRHHQRGDHKLCAPGRCEAVTPVVTSEESAGQSPERDVRPELGPRGSVLWLEMGEGKRLPALRAALLLELCRTADRLDRLDALLTSREAWFELWSDADSGVATVVVDKALAEARQQALAFKQLATEWRAMTAAPVEKPAKGPAVVEKAPEVSRDGIGDLTARIAARRGATAG